MMDADDNQVARSDVFLCLARAFEPPRDPEALGLLREALPEDLAELAALVGYDLAAPLAEYRAAIAAVPDAERLLVLYSRLFLVPGEPHPSLNTGVYLDGALGGGSVTALQTCYRRCGLEPGADVRDLPDHLSIQLEFLAWLIAAEARSEQAGAEGPPIRADEFLARFVAGWVEPFRVDVEAASRRFAIPDNPYVHLARLLEAAVRTEVASLGVIEEEAGPELDPEIARLRRELAGKTIDESDLAIIRARLAADGLPSNHVAIPVEARDRVMGLSTMTPPALPTHRMATAR
jgi:putative dimethyl sulfoxide reductase chaperone